MRARLFRLAFNHNRFDLQIRKLVAAARAHTNRIRSSVDHSKFEITDATLHSSFEYNKNKICMKTELTHSRRIEFSIFVLCLQFVWCVQINMSSSSTSMNESARLCARQTHTTRPNVNLHLDFGSSSC